MQYRNQILPFLVLCVLITVPYLPTLSGQFILDDHPMVNKNPYIKEFQSFLSYFSQEDGVSAHSKIDDYHSGYYRPLLNITYFLDYKLWGMRATGFRTTNLILHLMTCFLLYLVLSRYYDGIIVPLIVTLLFGLHPVNSETVSWTAARNNILVSLFSLASFYFYTSRRPEKKILSTSLSLLFFTMALFSKEFAVMLLPIFFLHNRLIINRELGRSRDEWIGYIPYVVILAFYFTMRWMVTQSVLSPGGFGSIWQRIYFVPYLIIYNLQLIFFPYGLHSFSVGYPKTLFNWQAAVGFGGVALIGLLLWQFKKEKMLLFSILSFVAGLFPVLNIVKASAVSLISMRWLYFPMMFLIMGLSRYIQKAMRVNQLLAVSALGMGIIYFGVYSYILNKNLWHDEDTFFRQEVLHFNNVFYAGGLAENLLNKKRYQEAERYFRVAINNYPHKAKNYINYSALLTYTGRVDNALLYLNKAKALFMTDCERGEWFNNMGMAYFKLKEQDKALKNFLKAVHFHPNEPQFWVNLGGAYGSAGDYQNSIAILKKGLMRFPDSELLIKNFAVSYYRKGDYEKAISVLERIPFQRREEDSDISRLLKEARQMLKSRSHY